MADLTLPYAATADFGGRSLFSLTATGGGTGVQGRGLGNDPQGGDAGTGVEGDSDVGTGVQGTSQSGNGVAGDSTSGIGVYGHSSTAQGVSGDSDNSNGIFGTTRSKQAAAISAVNDSGGPGVWARGSPAGYFETDADSDALVAKTKSANYAGVSAQNLSPAGGNIPSGCGLWASSNNTAIYGQGKPAGYFNGDVQVTGDLVLINSPSSGDVAEDFDLEDDPTHAEPGTVLVIGQSGKLRACAEAYDTRVAGVVSGAGELRPAVVLQRLNDRRGRSPIALIGKVVCKVDAGFGHIRPGDLLTTSPTLGRAMKVADRSKALGAILGKALAAHDVGCGMVPIMVSLR
jgi:hypothetical protein